MSSNGKKKACQTPRLKVYTDGSCVYMGAKRNGRVRGESGWGAVFTVDDVPFLEAGAYLGTSTSNRAEMIGAIQAIHIVGEFSKEMGLPLYLYTDSSYLQTGVTEWIDQWRERDWQTVQGTPVLNRDLWEILDELSRLYRVNWRWVQSHGTCAGNNRADEIARGFRAKNPPLLLDKFCVLKEITLLPLASMDDEVPSSSETESTSNFFDEVSEVSTDAKAYCQPVLEPSSDAPAAPNPWGWVQMLESSGGRAMVESERANRLKFQAEAQARWKALTAR